MTAYELMIKTNHYLIKGGELTDAHKDKIARRLLAAKSGADLKRWGHMYPIFFIPPDRNKIKYQTVIPMSPKTEILAQNSYELEIIRLLHMFSKNDEVSGMVKKTLERLRKTCFGYKECSTGECFESGVVALRFLAAVAPGETDWIKKQISVFNGHFFDKRRHSGVLLYFWLCLSELPYEIAEPEISRYVDFILPKLNKKRRKNVDENIHQVLTCAMRKTLSLSPKGEQNENNINTWAES